TFAFKVPGIVTTAVPLLAALLLYVRAHRAGAPRRSPAAVLLATVPLVLATYVILNPHIVDHHDRALADLVGRYRQTRDGGFSSVYLRQPGLPHLLSALWAIATAFLSPSRPLAALVCAAAVAGIVRGVRQRDPLVAIAAAYA